MYFGNTNSMVIHYPTCHQVSRISDINFAGFDSMSAAKRNGYRICKCCDPMTRKVSEYENEMAAFCREHAISFEVVNRELRIRTPFSQWKVYVGSKGGLDLYHRNTLGDTTGYHLQKEAMSDPLEILKYVDGHDSFRLANPLPKEKKKRVPPRKGTRRYRSMMRREKEAARRNEIRNTLFLIDSLGTI
ncbi:MAG: hypothetical protein E7227_02760 [Clostridiales bacterium]|nr:hypothetical protein [Clostridiales bacterium]